MEKFILIKKRKKAQGWGLDLIAAFTIFIAILAILYFYAINYTSQTEDKFNEMLYQGNLASELIFGEDSIGIMTDGQVDPAKLNSFDANYNLRKAAYGVKYDFYFMFNGNPSTISGKLNTTEVEDLVKITRIAVYNNKISKFELFMYDE